MPSLLPRPTRLSATDVPFCVFLVTVGLCLLRAADLPSLELGVGDTELSIGPADPLLLATAVLSVLRLRARRTVPSPWLLAAAAAFALLIVASAIPNGADALAAAGKLGDFAILTLGAAAFIDTRARFAVLGTFLVGFCIVATAWGAVEFVIDGGKRQGSFMGEHDLAALATMALVYGLAHVFASGGWPPRVALAGIGTGAVGIVLGCVAGKPARALRRRGSDGRAGARAARSTPPRGRPHTRDRLCGDGRDVRRAKRRPRLPAGLVRPAPGDARTVRCELEPAADLRLHRRPRLPRPSGPRHRLGR